MELPFLRAAGAISRDLPRDLLRDLPRSPARSRPISQADVVDYDELRTGMRREAQYASLAVLLPKLVPSAARATYATYAT